MDKGLKLGALTAITAFGVSKIASAFKSSSSGSSGKKVELMLVNRAGNLTFVAVRLGQS